MNPVSPWQKFLKIVAIISIVVDALAIVLGVLVATAVLGSSDIIDAASGITYGEAGAMVGTLMVVVSVISLLCALLVLRGANNPAKMKPGMILYGILSIFAVINVVTALIGGSDALTVIAQSVLTWLVFFGSVQVNKLAK